MNTTGLWMGIAVFACIGLFHPIVIKAEYYWGTGCWWVFLLSGCIALGGSVCVENNSASTILGVVAFSCFWSILELFEQKKRVAKGWFPRNEKRQERRKRANG